MLKSNAKQLVALLAVAYPKAAEAWPDATVELWAVLLCEDLPGDTPADAAAVKDLVKRSTYPPSVAEVIGAVQAGRARVLARQERERWQAELDEEDRRAVSWEQHVAALPAAERELAERTLGRWLGGGRLLQPADGDEAGSG